ncbi:MAG TPA: carbamoyltransferase N-terminal domain-containing protein [Gemmatimonadaceae bacterium]|nr:carbamoyltransferase N-terminal domain-containing protein [Gemmatimonadaceae bacterium]
MGTPTYVLGLSSFYHDSAACLVRDGAIVGAAQEERFSRVKGDAAFPARAAAWCLAAGGIERDALAAVAFYDKPLLKLDRLLETWLWTAPRGLRAFLRSGPLWSSRRLQLERAIRDGLGGWEGPLLWCEHHESHAASAFYPSPYRDAAVLTVDGVGEWATAAIGAGAGAELTLLREQHFPDSLGLLYSAFTYHAGFRVNSGEYKLMGLAPYGTPRYADAIRRELLDLRDDGSFTLNRRYFGFLDGLAMTNEAFAALFGGPPRAPESVITQREMDLARSVQEVTEEVVLRMARTAVRVTGHDALCMAGGVALNAVANGRLLREGVARRLWVQPAAGDAGGAIGAALLAWHRWFGGARTPAPTGDAMRGALLGPAFAAAETAAALRRMGARFDDLGRDGTIAAAADALAGGQVIGWFDGALEFGPRALGARSILADARDARMQAAINLKVKFREGFRPFAPAVLAERAAEYFELPDGADAAPYMLLVVPVRAGRRRAMSEVERARWGIDLLHVARSDVPAVTHVDYSARLQTVTATGAPGLRMVLEAFEARTGCPLLVNTSFNVRGEPIVCTPEEAFACFMRTELDALAIPPFFLRKGDQSPMDSAAWSRPLPLD